MKSARALTSIAAVAIAAFSLNDRAIPVHAQTTLTWATPGINPNIGDGGNWDGGVAPNFANDTTADSAIFSTSTNTAVRLRDVTTSDSFAVVTFDAAAPAYTFSLPAGNTTNDLVILPAGNMTNSSANTQTFTALPDISINSAVGQVGKLIALTGNAGTHRSFDLNQLKFNNAGGTNVNNISQVDLAAGADVRTVAINGVANEGVSSSLNVFSSLADGTGGTLFITGDSGTNTGRLVIGTGVKVQISNNNALGVGGLTSTDETRIGGGGTNNGRLELVGNITVNEGFVLGARQNNLPAYDNHLSPHILNVSGSNTLTGPFSFGTGGNSYNFGSSGGTLIIQSDVSPTASFDRYFSLVGAGAIVFNGNIIGGTGSNAAVPLQKYDSGTTTLNGSANVNISNIAIHAGTIALGPLAEITFAPIATDTDLQIQGRVHIAAGATFDVSAKAGGFTLTESLQGSGTVAGSLAIASGKQVIPGGTLSTTSDPQGYAITGYNVGAGKLTVQNNLDLSAGAEMVWTLGALSTSNPGVDFAQLSVGGNLTLGGTSGLVLDFSILDLVGTGPGSADAFWTSNHSWKIVDTAGNAGNTNFTTLVNAGPFAGGGTFTASVGATASIAGDANNDGVVNIFDINFVSSNWGTTGPNGDVNHDNTVNIFDINLISSNWNLTGPVGNLGDILLNYSAPSATTAVPEPTSGVLLTLGALAMLLGVARRKRRQ